MEQQKEIKTFSWLKIGGFICAGLLIVSVLICFFNVGGRLSGFDLMKMLFRMFPDIPQGGKFMAIWLLLLSHVGILLSGVLGAVFYCLHKKIAALICSIIVIISGILGLLGGIIGEWNFVAEVIPLSLGFICVIICLLLGRRKNSK